MRKWLMWSAVAIIGASLGEQLIWLEGTHALVAGLDHWETQARAQGWTVSEGSRFTDGWPFVASLTVSDVAIAGGQHLFPGGVAWKTDRMTLAVSLAAPFTLSVRPEGQEVIRLSHMKRIVLNADHIVAEVPLRQQGSGEGKLFARGVTAGVADSGHPQDVRLESLGLQLHTQQAGSGGLVAELAVDARGVGLPDIGHWPLGDTIAAAGGTIRLSSPGLAGGHGPHGEVSAWRDGGGHVSLQDISLRWGRWDCTERHIWAWMIVCSLPAAARPISAGRQQPWMRWWMDT